MAKHFDAMMVGACSIGKLPSQGCCRDSDVATHVYKDEARQVCQKILRCLDMRVLDGDLIVPTCLWMPTLILPAGCFIQMYYDPDAQGCMLPSSPAEARASYNLGEISEHLSSPETSECFLPMCERSWMSTSTGRNWKSGWIWTKTRHEHGYGRQPKRLDDCRYMALQPRHRYRWLCVMCSRWLQPPGHKNREYYYDSDNSVLDLDEEYPDLAEQVVEWQAT